MNHLRTILAALLFAAAPASAQTIKTLGYNTTNGNVVAATNLIFTNTNTTFQNATISDQTLTLSHGPEDDVFIRNESGNLELGSLTNVFFWLDSAVQSARFNVPFDFNNSSNAAVTRTNLGLGQTNSVTFSNLTTSGTLTATGNITMAGTGNTAPNQKAASGSSIMTRDLANSNPLWALHSVRPMGAYSFNNAGTSSVASENYVRGGGIATSGTSTNGYGRMSVYRGVNDAPGFTGAGVGFAQNISVAALVTMSTPTTNTVYRIIVGGNGGVPAPADSNALTVRGFGVEFALGSAADTLKARLFAHNGTGYTNSAWTDDLIGTFERQRHVIISSETSGTVSLFLSSSPSPRMSPERPSTTPLLTLSGGPTNGSGGAFVDVAAVNSSTNAPASSGTIIFFNGMLEVK